MFRGINKPVEGKNPQSIADSNNVFAFSLYKRIADSVGKNIVFSPLSVSSALALTYEGAKGETSYQICKVMHFTADKDAFKANFRSLIEKIEKDTTDTNRAIQFNMANSVWVAGGIKMLSSYTDLIKMYYDAKASNMKLSSPSAIESTRKEINTWVGEKTHGKIDNMIGPGGLDASAKLVLINAMYFDARWANTFPEALTKKNIFYANGADSETVDFMNGTYKLMYYQDSDMEAVDLPYYMNKLSMIVFLPRKMDGVHNMEKILDYNNYANITEKLIQEKSMAKVVMSLPKFRISESLSLADVLVKMGMPIAFTSMADFTGMTNDGLHISIVDHKTYIDVSEKGTEAAAATKVQMRITSARPTPMKPIYFIANHPFIFVIRDNVTGCILFMGRISNPLKA